MTIPLRNTVPNLDDNNAPTITGLHERYIVLLNTLLYFFQLKLGRLYNHQISYNLDRVSLLHDDVH